MDTKVLIDSIMRQTTVLIAQLSATAGLRAPLAHIADEVFLSLSQELEAQGVSRTVVADMFGLALRGYQRRVQRLRESATESGKTLWQVMLEYLQQRESVTRRELFDRFRHDDATAVAAVLNDLVTSGLAFRSGTGTSALYRVTADEDRRTLAREGELETAGALVWLELCRDPETTPDALARQLSLPLTTIEVALRELRDQGRLDERDGVFYAEPMIIPLDAAAGWEAAVFDHFRTVCAAINNKLRQGQTRATATDLTGGRTLSFEICEGHPQAARVCGLLASVRALTDEVWAEVEAQNRQQPISELRKRRVSFYFGQSFTPSEEDEE